MTEKLSSPVVTSCNLSRLQELGEMTGTFGGRSIEGSVDSVEYQ